MKPGLFLRLVISLGAILCIALGVSGYMLLADAEQRFEQSRKNEAYSLVYVLAEGSQDALVVKDFEMLERLVRSIVEHDNYVHAYLATANGQILSHSSPGKVSHYIDPVGELTDRLERELVIDDQIVRETIYPLRINEQHLANAHIGYIYDRTAFFREHAMTIIMVLLSFLLLMGVVLFFITRHIIGPFAHITAVISRSSLDSPQTIETNILNRTDEAGALATAFNDLQWKLHTSYTQLTQESSNLKMAISEREKALEQLRLSAAVVENTAEAITITDENNKIIAINKAFTEITGYIEAEVMGKNPKILKSARHDKNFYKTMWNRINQDGQWQGEIWDRRKNGKVFPAWNTITAVYDGGGNISNYVSVFSDISTLKKSQEDLDFLAHHDPLTNLPNRILLNDRIDHAIQHAERENRLVGVLFLDLDRFKNINDSLGHPLGDALLQRAAQRILQLVRKEDTVARLGGDEFIIVMEDIGKPHDVAIMAQKINAAFQQPFIIDKRELHVTTSMGISLYPRDGRDSEALVKNADAAMYQAKEEGRNDYRFYTIELSVDVFKRLTLENSLRQSLSRNELVLFYQPQYSLTTGSLSGAEALLRWQHPDMGLIGPDKFITLAEESGLIIPIGEWVMQTACSQMKRWLQVGYCVERVAVNVSGVQFLRGDIVGTVKCALEQTGVESRHLELEITESSLMQKTDWAISTINQLKTLGVAIAIDDFGTGYSSLSYLKRLPIDKLKIDQSFVRDTPHDLNDVAITRAVVALSQSLQLGVIAEGIETEEQLSFLKTLGCDEGQGYLYGRPMAAEDFVQHCIIT